MTHEDSQKNLSRGMALALLDAALESSSFRFARQTALSWLANFPGDLQINLDLALALLGEGKVGQAIPLLEKLVLLDPEFRDVYETMELVYQGIDVQRAQFVVASLYGLGREVGVEVDLPEWSLLVRRGRQSMKQGNMDQAGQFIRGALDVNPDCIQAALIHLELLYLKKDTNELHSRAAFYHERWPDTLHIALRLAEAKLDIGQEAEAVRLLHHCAANDADAQVPIRLWGREFPFLPLWPETLAIHYDTPVPADVAAVLGWNQLAAEAESVRGQGEPASEAPAGASAVFVPTVNEQPFVSIPSASPAVKPPAPAQPAAAAQAPTQPTPLTPSTAATQPSVTISTQGTQSTQATSPAEATASSQPAAAQPIAPVNEESTPEPLQRYAAEVEPLAASVTEPAAAPTQPTAAPGQPAKPAAEKPKAAPGQAVNASEPNLLRSVEEEFDRLAQHLKTPPMGRVDGRFPVYVIFSTRAGLAKQFGAQSAAVVDSEMRRLSAEISKRADWAGLVFYPDDSEIMGRLGIEAVNSNDPWRLKLALVDLDRALAKKGEMIGAVLIVGGPEIVPFHQLPNPTDDVDATVLSDNPYATMDSNYFVPEWPVGRLPGEIGPDAGLLLDQIRSAIKNHTRNGASKSKPKVVANDPNGGPGISFGQRLIDLLRLFSRRRGSASFGYSAAVWQRSSLAVYRTIGDPSTILTCPPEFSGSFDPENITNARLGYYNLHGLEDASEWFGQRDPSDSTPGPDYPVALSPKDIKKNGSSPKVVFTEACYGAHIVNKNAEQALSLKFLSLGTLAVVGSTTVSYGSVTSPLIAADLLGSLFWKYLKEGLPTGTALMQAKVELVREMNRRQGYLDGEDQKTLISFVLYGDPLVRYDAGQSQSKAVMRFKIHPKVKTVCDLQIEQPVTQVVSSETLKQVKKIVASYLPGSDNAEMHICQEQVVGENGEARTANGEPGAKTGRSDATNHLVVTVSKRVEVAHTVHHHYARVKLDDKGKMVKLAVSR